MNQYKILVVEDEGIAALSLKESLEHFGFLVTALASNRGEALKALEEQEPDLVLMDIHLDEKEEGIEIGKEIHRDKGLPVVFLTANADQHTILKAKEAFPYGYIIKPYVENELLAVVEMAIHKSLADKRQRELNLLKDKFYSMVAHDLKSPLAALVFTTRLLNRKAHELSKEDLQGFIQEIHETVENLYRFTENMLEWSKGQNGSRSFFPEKIQLQEIINEVFHLLQKNADHKGIKLLQNVGEEMVLADRNMLRSVLMNLVQNGIKFSYQGGEVSVSVFDAGSNVQLLVRDKGVGMGQEQISHLFDFRKTRHTPGTEEEKGTGLGLLLCKEFVEANGGGIQVHSIKGSGTEIRVVFPKLKEA